MQLILHRFALRLRHTFTIAHDSRDVQQTLIVELRDASGLSGLGEATANPYYGVTIERMMQALEAVRPQIEAADALTPTDLWAQLQPPFTDKSICAVCARRSRQRPGRQAGEPAFISVLGAKPNACSAD